MSSAPAGPNAGFQDRLNRVAQVRAPIEAEKPEVSVLPDWKKDVADKAGFLVAILIGVVAVFLVRIGAYHMTGTALISDTPDQTLAVETGGALALSVVLLLLTRYRSLIFIPITAVGVVLMTVAMHNAVHSAPGLFSLAFSPDWTAKVTETTEPQSLYFRGEVIQLKPKQEKAAPTVLRLG